MSEPTSVQEVQFLESALVEQEVVIQQAMRRFYYDVGTALRKIRDERLYLARYNSFKEWCEASRDRLGFGSLRNAFYILEGCETADRMIAAGFDPPPSERHARELNKLPSDDQIAVWSAAIAAHKTALSELVRLVEARKKEIFPVQNADPVARKRVLETLTTVLPQATVEERIDALTDVRERNYKGNAFLEAVLAKYPETQRTQKTISKIQGSCVAVRRELQELIVKKAWWASVGDRKCRVVSVLITDGCETFDIDADAVVQFFKR